MRDNLYLVGDEGLEAEIERAFDVRLSDEEYAAMVTVGDVHAALVHRLTATPGACATSMTFYRLRRALRLMGMSGRVGPDAVLPSGFIRRPNAHFAALSRWSGLWLPPTYGGWMMSGGLLVALVAVGLVIFGIAAHVNLAFWIAAALTLIAIMLAWLDPGRLPAELATVGGLARAAAPINFGRLARQGARVNDDGVWAALCEVIGCALDIPPDAIGRETLLVA